MVIIRWIGFKFNCIYIFCEIGWFVFIRDIFGVCYFRWGLLMVFLELGLLLIRVMLIY